MGRLCTRIRYRFLQMNTVERLVVFVCSTCVFLLIYTIQVYENLQEQQTYKIRKIRELPKTDESHVMKPDKVTTPEDDDGFMELSDFNVENDDDDDASDNNKKGIKIKDNSYQQQNNLEPERILRVDNNRNSYQVADNLQRDSDNSHGEIEMESIQDNDEMKGNVNHNDLIKSQGQVLIFENQKSFSVARDRKHPNKDQAVYVQGTGGLGNKMFQYAALIGISGTNGRKPVLIPDVDFTSIFPHISAKVGFIPSGTSITQSHEIRPSVYSPHLMTLPDKDVVLCCYLQSYKYFLNYEPQIRKELTFSENTLKAAQGLINNAVKSAKMRFHPLGTKRTSIKYILIGVHVRRGDYASDFHYAQGYTVASASYINKAMEHFRTKYRYVIFLVTSDDPKWCKRHLVADDIIMVTTGDARTDLAIQSKCNHTIMTVGSFGWWSAWLAGGDVIYYENWPRPNSEMALSVRKKDYFLPNWLPMGD